MAEAEEALEKLYQTPLDIDRAKIEAENITQTDNGLHPDDPQDQPEPPTERFTTA